MRASHWQDYAPGDEIVKEGEMDDRFYVVVSGNCAVERHGQSIGMLSTGECFGETSYVPGRQAHRDHTGSRCRDGAEGELDPARTGLGVLPAALQPRVPARADRTTAGPRYPTRLNCPGRSSGAAPLPLVSGRARARGHHARVAHEPAAGHDRAGQGRRVLLGVRLRLVVRRLRLVRCASRPGAAGLLGPEGVRLGSCGRGVRCGRVRFDRGARRRVAPALRHAPLQVPRHGRRLHRRR